MTPTYESYISAVRARVAQQVQMAAFLIWILAVFFFGSNISLYSPKNIFGRTVEMPTIILTAAEITIGKRWSRQRWEVFKIRNT